MSCEEGLEESEFDSDFTIESQEEYNDDSSSDDEVSNESSDTENVDMTATREWYSISTIDSPPKPPRFNFTGASSLNFETNEDMCSDVMTFVRLFLGHEFLEIVVRETNKEANRRAARNWENTDNDEMLVFIAANMLMSLVKKPNLQQYWTKRHIIETPIFPKIMKRKRFMQLKKHLHFNDDTDFNRETHPAPKLFKIWPIFNLLHSRFQEVYTPARDVTIDESLLMFKGRLGWKQYIPLKRARFGIKSFLLCESKSGYIWSMIVYTGKGTAFDPEYTGHPISTQIVLSMMKPLLDKGYCLTTDNFYTSPLLADILVKHKTDSYGTVKLNRKEMPVHLKKQKLKKGECAAYQRGKVMALMWRDKKDVSLLSTVHTCDTIERATRYGPEKKNIPTVVVDYNNTMGGVDRVDQHLADYPVIRKRGKRYYKKNFFHLVEFALWNSYVLYGKCGGKLSHLEYRMEIIEKIIEAYGREVINLQGRRRSAPNPLRMVERHFPDYVPSTSKKTNTTRVCVVCSKKRDARGKRVRRESRYQCPDCDVGLCVTPCFCIYHTKVDF